MAAEEQGHNDGELEQQGSAEARRGPKAQLPGLPRATSQTADDDDLLDSTALNADGHPFSDALELVRAASDALERMRARYREMETYASQQAEYYRSELTLAHTGMRELQEQNDAQEEAIQRLEGDLRNESEQRRRLEEMLKATTDLSDRLQGQLAQAEARISSAEAWLSRFQGEIAAAFGEIPRILGEISDDESAHERKIVHLRQG